MRLLFLRLNPEASFCILPIFVGVIAIVPAWAQMAASASRCPHSPQWPPFSAQLDIAPFSRLIFNNGLHAAGGAEFI